MTLQIKNSLGATVSEVVDFTFSEAAMGDASITCDVKFEASTDPAFALTWYVTFRGENFYLATLKPPAVKDTSSLYYVYSLVFKSEREDLKRYVMQDFAEMPVGEAALVPESDNFSFYGDLEQFKDRFNLNLEYWLGSRWEMEINPSYTPDTTVLVSCSYAYLWDLLQQVYELFGVRWYIAEETGVMKIKVAYAPEEITHIFEYGKSDGTDKGLVSIIRNNPLNDIYTRMSGKGSTKNVPSNYFKDATDEFPIADPDRNDLLEFVYFPNLMPKMYRDYMKGWNQSEAEGERLAGQTDAWYQGYDDEDSASAINPTDYLLSDNASIYGVRCGVLEPNEDIYPTLQGATDEVLGELDAVIAVEEVTNDVYEEDSSYYTIDGDRTEDIPSISANLSVNYNDDDTVSKVSDTFFVLEADNKIDFKFSVAANTIDQGWGSYEIDPSYGFTVGVVVSLHKASDDSLVDSYSVSAVMSGESSFSNVTADEYYLKITTTIDNNTTVDEPNRTGGDTTVYYDISTVTSLGNVKIYDYGTETAIGNYKQTFDIWIKNVWGSTKDGGETDEEYVHRIWDPLLTVQDITVMWSDGMLAGDDYEFKVAKINGVWQIFYDTSKSYGGVDSEWRLTLIKSDAELEASNKQLPNISQNAVAGDHFFFININMPYDPYVYDAEERVQDWIEEEMALVDGEFPTYSIIPSKIFMDSFADVGLLRAGNLVRLRDVRLIGASYITQHITSLVLNYTASSMLPEWELTISDAVTVNSNPVSLLQGQIDKINSNTASSSLKISDIAKSLNGTFLRKDGVADTSYSATTFKEGVTIEKSVVSDDFVRGDFGGTGMGLYRDANGATVVEADKFVARKEMRVNELIINQVKFLGGKTIYSAAGIEVTSVTDEGTSFRLYFDTKNGTRPNQFVVNDQAFCQRYDPNSGTTIKYYWSLVTDIGVDYIEIDKTDSDGTGMPVVGDDVVQMGHRTNASRQSCLIIDQLNGGSVVQYAGINSFSLTDKNYVGFGVNPSTGEAYNYTYGETYIGDRDIDDPDATFVTFQQRAGDTAKKVYIKADIQIGSGSSGLSNLSEWSDVETAIETAQDTADSKKINFTSTPTTPYDIGDTWSGLSAGDLKVCTTARASGAYVAGDWELASKYTDDTTAIASALVGNPNLISDGYINGTAYTSSLSPLRTVKLEAGKTYTFSWLAYSTGTWACSIRYYSGVTIIENHDAWRYSADGAYSIKSLTFTATNSGTFRLDLVRITNPSTLYITWVMLQEGSVYIDQNTKFKQTALEDVANKENLLEDSVVKTIEAGTSDDKYIELTSDGFELGGLYTFSVDSSELIAGSATNFDIAAVSTNSGSPVVSLWTTITIGSTRRSVTFKMPSVGTNLRMHIYAGTSGSTSGNTLVLNKIMIQKGPFSTPWKHAQADIDSAGTTADWGGLTSVPAFISDVSSAGLYISENYLGYYNGSDWLSYIDNYGNCKFVGVAELGTQAVGVGSPEKLTIKYNDIYESSALNPGTLYINRYGYNGGTSISKGLIIGDGQDSFVAEFNVNGERETILYKLETSDAEIINATFHSAGAVTFEGTVETQKSVNMTDNSATALTTGHLNVAHNYAFDGKYFAATFLSDGNSTSAQGIAIQAGKDTPTTAPDTFIAFYDGNGEILGGLTHNTTSGLSLYTISDEIYKANIVDSDISGLSVLSSLPIRDFNWRKKDKQKNPTDEYFDEKITGYIAQEALKIIPAMVSYDELRDIYMINKEALIPYLHKAILELKQEINDLKNKRWKTTKKL